MKAVKKAAKKAVAKKAPPKKEATKVSGKMASPSHDQSVSVRKIANGYVTRTSGEVNGKYVENETFSKNRPTVTIPKD